MKKYSIIKMVIKMKKVILEGLDKSEKIVFKSGNPIYKIPEDFGYEPKDRLVAKSVDGKIELISEEQFGFENLGVISDAKLKKASHQIKQTTHDSRIKKALKPYGNNYKVSEEGTINLYDLVDEEKNIEIKAKKTVKY